MRYVRRRVRAEWEPLLLYGFVYTRAAVNTPTATKTAVRHMSKTYVRLGWLRDWRGQPCVICHAPAQLHHHPSYERGFQEVVQPMCQSCHDDCHNKAVKLFVGQPNTQWECWRTEDMAAVADSVRAEITDASAS